MKRTFSLGLVVVALYGPGGPVPAAGQGTADLTRVFRSWEAWESAYDDLVAAIDAFDALTTEAPVDAPERLVVVMEARDRVYRAARRVEDYVYLRLQLDSADEEARSRRHLLDATDRRWSVYGLPWLMDTIAELGRERIERWIAGEAALRPYAFYFRCFFDREQHVFPEEREELGRLSAIFGRQLSRAYEAIAVSEAPRIEVTLASGEALELTPARAWTILGELPGAADRRAVSRAWLEALGRRSQTYAALLEGVVRREKLLAEVRGFGSALEAALHGDAIPPNAVQDAVRAAREASAPVRRYHALRKRVLGLDAYGLADRFVPLDPGSSEIPFEEARRLLVDSASTLGPEVQDLVRRAFSEGWIDAVERPGKRPHGGATFVAGHPYVLVSYRGSLAHLFQLSHEIGHAVHALLAYRAQPFVNSHPSSLTGEAVASVFEGVLVARMVDEAASREERIRALDLSIQNLLRLFHRPMLDADFELRIYEEEGPITGPSLGALYLAVVGELYGEAMTPHPLDAHAWQTTPHYYTAPLYLGRYGLSSAAANTLVARLTSSEPSEAARARRALLELMLAGGSAYPMELLGRAGADLRDPRTVRDLVNRLDSLVAALERAVDGT